ncbi:MAG: type IV pilus modification PilV family protein [bacterium]
MRHFDEGGFTLIEVLLALVILSIAIIPLMQIFPQASLIATDSQRETRIGFLAQQKLEQVKGQVLSYFFGDYNESATAFPSPDSDFKYTVSYFTASGDDGNQIKSIKVRVWYDDNDNNIVDGNENMIELTTKVSRRV